MTETEIDTLQRDNELLRNEIALMRAQFTQLQNKTIQAVALSTSEVKFLGDRCALAENKVLDLEQLYRCARIKLMELGYQPDDCDGCKKAKAYLGSL